MNRDPDAPTVPLVSYPKVDAAALVGRSECVRFQAFQSYCPQRRRDGDNECAHNLSRSYRCSEETCPIVTQVYVEDGGRLGYGTRSEEHTSEIQSLMRISYAVFCLKQKKKITPTIPIILIILH